MAIRTVLNGKYIEDVLIWECRLSLNQLNERAGLSSGYLRRLISTPDEDGSVTLATIDKIYNAAAQRLAEINIAPRDTLWESLITHLYT